MFSQVIYNMPPDYALESLAYLACETDRTVLTGFAFFTFLEDWSYQSCLSVQWNMAFIKRLLKQKYERPCQFKTILDKYHHPTPFLLLSVMSEHRVISFKPKFAFCPNFCQAD